VFLFSTKKKKKKEKEKRKRKEYHFKSYWICSIYFFPPIFFQRRHTNFLKFILLEGKL